MEMMSEFWNGPAEAMLGNVDDDGIPEHKMWADPVSGARTSAILRTWEFYNFPPMPPHACP